MFSNIWVDFFFPFLFIYCKQPLFWDWPPVEALPHLTTECHQNCFNCISSVYKQQNEFEPQVHCGTRMPTCLKHTWRFLGAEQKPYWKHWGTENFKAGMQTRIWYCLQQSSLLSAGRLKGNQICLSSESINLHNSPLKICHMKKNYNLVDLFFDQKITSYWNILSSSILSLIST